MSSMLLVGVQTVLTAVLGCSPNKSYCNYVRRVSLSLVGKLVTQTVDLGGSFVQAGPGGVCSRS